MDGALSTTAYRHTDCAVTTTGPDSPLRNAPMPASKAVWPPSILRGWDKRFPAAGSRRNDNTTGAFKRARHYIRPGFVLRKERSMSCPVQGAAAIQKVRCMTDSLPSMRYAEQAERISYHLPLTSPPAKRPSNPPAPDRQNVDPQSKKS